MTWRTTTLISPPVSSPTPAEVEAELCVLDDGPRGIAGFVASLVRIYRTEGLGALYAGATTRALYIAVLSALQFFLYEYAKQLLGVARPDIQLFFDVLSGLQLDTVA